VVDGALIADFGPFNAQSLCLAIDAFARGPLRVNGVVERAVAIQSDAHLATAFPVDILDAAFAFDKLLMSTEFACRLGEEQGAAEALSPVAVGMVELVGRRHAQAGRTEGARHQERARRRDGHAG
jgi:hypothetical protein